MGGYGPPQGWDDAAAAVAPRIAAAAPVSSEADEAAVVRVEAQRQLDELARLESGRPGRGGGSSSSSSPRRRRTSPPSPARGPGRALAAGVGAAALIGLAVTMTFVHFGPVIEWEIEQSGGGGGGAAATAAAAAADGGGGIIESLCSRDAIGTLAGYVECERACLAAGVPDRCSADGEGGGGGVRGGECAAFEACENLGVFRGGEYSAEDEEGNYDDYDDDDDYLDDDDDEWEDDDDDESVRSRVQRLCSPESLTTDAGEDECASACAPAAQCCFASDDVARTTWARSALAVFTVPMAAEGEPCPEDDDGTWCDDYAPCAALTSVLFMEGITDALSDTMMGAVCAGGTTNACEAICLPAACCFRPDIYDAEDCSVDCSLYREPCAPLDWWNGTVADTDIGEHLGATAGAAADESDVSAFSHGGLAKPIDDEDARAALNAAAVALTAETEKEEENTGEDKGEDKDEDRDEDRDEDEDANAAADDSRRPNGFAPSICAPNRATARYRCRNPEMPPCDHPVAPTNGPSCHVRCDDATGFGEDACTIEGELCVRFVQGCLCPVPPCDEDGGGGGGAGEGPDGGAAESAPRDEDDPAAAARGAAADSREEGTSDGHALPAIDVAEEDDEREVPTPPSSPSGTPPDVDDGEVSIEPYEDEPADGGGGTAFDVPHAWKKPPSFDGFAPSVCAPNMATAQYWCSDPDMPICDHPSAPSRRPCHVRCDVVTGFGEDACTAEGERCVKFVEGCL